MEIIVSQWHCTSNRIPESFWASKEIWFPTVLGLAGCLPGNDIEPPLVWSASWFLDHQNVQPFCLTWIGQVSHIINEKWQNFIAFKCKTCTLHIQSFVCVNVLHFAAYCVVSPIVVYSSIKFIFLPTMRELSLFIFKYYLPPPIWYSNNWSGPTWVDRVPISK